MKYTTLGKTGLQVSRLGFGGMRFPYVNGKPDLNESVRILNIGFDKGINFFDTGNFYCDGQSENILGAFTAGKRDKVILSTKNMKRAKAEFVKDFDQSLKNLKTDYIDLYHFWSLSGEDFKKVTAAEGLLEFAYRMKKEGRARHFAFSFHDENPANVKDIIDSGMFESVLLSFSMINRVNGEWLEYAHKKGMGTAIMNPVAGGAIMSPNPKIKAYPNASNARVALKFAFGLPYVDVALSGMSNEAQVLENCENACGDYAFAQEDKECFENICKVYDSLLRLYCTGCNYCKGCPAGIDIPAVFKIYNAAKVTWQGWGGAKTEYAKLKTRADKCTACGVCMKKCPQKLDIIKHLKECEKSLT